MKTEEQITKRRDDFIKILEEESKYDDPDEEILIRFSHQKNILDWVLA